MPFDHHDPEVRKIMDRHAREQTERALLDEVIVAKTTRNGHDRFIIGADPAGASGN